MVAANRSRRSSAEVRRLLIEEAARQFARLDYDDATVKDIADSVGVSVSVFYRHFEGKEAIYEAAILAPLLAFLEDFVPTWQDHQDEPFEDLEQMRQLVDGLYQNVSEHSLALRAFVGRGGDLEPALTNRLNGAVERIFHRIILMADFETDRRRWRLTPNEVDQTIRLIISMILGAIVFEQWILPDDRPEQRRLLVERMVNLLLWGTAGSGRSDSPT